MNNLSRAAYRAVKTHGEFLGFMLLTIAFLSALFFLPAE